MRRCFVAALFLGVLGVTTANTADAPAFSNGFGVYSPLEARIEPVIIYDFEPGVIVRSYWDVPWQNRHYFPKTGRRPKAGRLEHLPGRRVSRAEDYYRHWSVSSVFAPEPIPLGRYPAPNSLPRYPYPNQLH
jgi:hypothetical protein